MVATIYIINLPYMREYVCTIVGREHLINILKTKNYDD